MTTFRRPPDAQELELTLFGPGYGESMVVHVGHGTWLVIDSFVGPNKIPAAIRYLNEIGVEPAQSVALVAATHWHDDHIQGIAQILELCPSAEFCCSAALQSEEFLKLVGRSEKNHFSGSGSGLREFYRVFSYLYEKRRSPKYAIANRKILVSNQCEVWSLSPDDSYFQKFLSSISNMFLQKGEDKLRLSNITPNEISVVFWITCGKIKILLGADLEKKGWTIILSNSTRPTGKASLFKVPHHGSKNAYEPMMWQQMLIEKPYSVVAPWSLGGNVLPSQQDATRILKQTPRAWITKNQPLKPTSPAHKKKALERTLREGGTRMYPLTKTSFVRLRRPIDSSSDWNAETFGAACHLSEYSV